MEHGFKIEKRGEEQIARFQDVEMVSEEIFIADPDAAIKEIREANILNRRPEGDNDQDEGEGFGEYRRWIDREEWSNVTLPPTIAKAFQAALLAEQKYNPNGAEGCHISIRVQGNIAVLKQEQGKKGTTINGVPVWDLHFDGDDNFGHVSEYILASPYPTTIQYLGEGKLRTRDAITEEEIMLRELEQADHSELRPTSLLPGRMYHMTHQTPHSEPTMETEVMNDDRPRLFVRFMFREFSDKEIVPNDD